MSVILCLLVNLIYFGVCVIVLLLLVSLYSILVGLKFVSVIRLIVVLV